MDKIINNSHFYVHRDFYEQFLLYSRVWDFVYYKNIGINSNQHEHINQYISIFQDLIPVISEERLGLMYYRPDKWEGAVYDELKQIKTRLAEQWEAQAVDLSEANFYKKNNEILEELNAFVKHEIKYHQIRGEVA